MYEVSQQSTFSGVIVWVGAEYGMVGVWRTIVALQANKMTGKEDLVEYLGRGIRWVSGAIDLE
jgi:hypothetical protein